MMMRKILKHRFLWQNYKPLSCDDNDMYIHLHRSGNFGFMLPKYIIT